MSTFDRRKREKERRRNDIINAALKLFASKGFNNTTVDDIANEIELSKGTIYLYFESKEDIFHKLIKDKLAKFNHTIKSCLKSKGSAIDVLKYAIQAHLEFFESQKQLIKILLFEQKWSVQDESPVQQILVSHREEHIKMICKLLKPAFKEGLFKKVNIRKAAAILIGLLYAVTGEWIFTDEVYKLSDEKDLVFDLFCNGLKIKEN
ncbi:TetR/AcrR family transcriptional regulator [bacterium]|nr:TetR/AcrR family transcriptional regulator [bacterium]